MSATFSVGEFKDQMKTSLEARGGLAGVTVYDYEVNTEDLDREAIVLGDWSGTDAPLTQGPGGTYAEEYDVTGRIITKAPDTAKAARDRGLAIMKEIKDQLDADHTVNSKVFFATFGGMTSGAEDLWSDGGRRCELEFVLNVEAHHS